MRAGWKPGSFRPAIVALGVALSAAGCGGDAEVVAEAGRPVAVQRVDVATLEERIEGSGQLLAKERAEIASEVDGVVTELLVDEGDPVEAGRLLLAIDPEKHGLSVRNARAQLTDAQAALDEAKREYDRVLVLHEKGIASDATRDQRATSLARARSQVEAARAGYGVAERALRDASVRAPFAGWVARRSVSRGEYVRPGQVLFELVALDPIEVEFTVTERDSARVHIGQRVRVTVAPYPDEGFEGEVSVISPIVDPKTRTLRVKARIANADGRLRPGLFARTDLGIAERPGALLVPEQAVLQRADGEVVFVATSDDVARRVVVKTGLHRDGKVEIVEGLDPDDEVIVRGHAALVDGSPIARPDPAGVAADDQSNVTAEGAPVGAR
jgi:membrane fusion protein (multidrug efflux system)